MSISVYAMNYNNVSLQGKENGTKSVTQTSEDVKKAEIQQSADNIRLTKGDIREDGTVSLVQRRQGTEAYRQISAGEDGNLFQTESIGRRLHSGNVQLDEVEISEEGRLANAKMTRQESNVNLENTESQLPEYSVSEAGYEAEDLSEYTDAELKQMYYQGEITREEYENETGDSIE